MEVTDPEKIEEAVAGNEKVRISEDNPAEQLFNALRGLNETASWMRTISIENKQEELERFKDAWEDDDGHYKPKFEFAEPEIDLDLALDVIKQLNSEAKKLGPATLKEYGFRKMKEDEVRNLFRGCFQELELHLKAAKTINDFEKWRENCGKIWRIGEKSARRSKKVLRRESFEKDHGEKDLDASDVKKMFEEELQSLGIDYTVETRQVAGCHNIPEEKILVVSEGDVRKRSYSREEAELLTKHETFHVIRSVNGYEASESGFPPILGIQTPFYDRAEEGGAVTREKETGVQTDQQIMEYHIRNVVAHEIAKGTNFMEAVENVVSMGADPSRAFGLLARNREVLRHQIYIGGFMDWQDIDREKMMVGKVNQDWASTVWKEVEADGAFSKPRLTPDKVFSQ